MRHYFSGFTGKANVIWFEITKLKYKLLCFCYYVYSSVLNFTSLFHCGNYIQMYLLLI